LSLFKQIVLILSAFILLVLAGVMWLNFQSASKFVQNQLYTTSQDAATSLGLTLSSVSDPSDVASMETMLNAVFDSGYYRRIELLDNEGKSLIKRVNDGAVKGVPQWFINKVDIEIPKAESVVQKGWTPIGTLEIQAHTGYAYLRLWETLRNLVTWFSLIAIGTVFGIFVLLKIILKSLDRVKEQALSIINNSFIVQTKLPFTTEFRQLVLSMNKMVKKVENIFEKSAQSVKRYHEMLYYDGLTKLGNRKFFILNLDNYLLSSGELSQGYLVLVSLADINDLKNVLQYKEIDDLLVHMADTIKEEADKNSNYTCSRLSGGDFAMLLPAVEKEFAAEVASRINEKVKVKCLEIREGVSSIERNDVCCVNVGAVNYRTDDSKNNILTRADHALTLAKNKGCFNVEVFEEKEGSNVPIRGKNEWRKEIIGAIEEDRLKIALQSVKTDSDEVFHQEMFLRMQDSSGEMLSAGAFIPQAVSMGFTNTLDQYAFSKVFSFLKKGTLGASVAINVSLGFIKDTAMMHWLENELSDYSRTTDIPICFEMTNFAVSQNVSIIAGFANMLRDKKCLFGIDNFTASSENLDYFKMIRPNYLKISQSYLFEMTGGQGKGIDESLSIAASTYDIKMIASNIETEEQMSALKNAGIKYFQGNFIEEAKIIGD